MIQALRRLGHNVSHSPVVPQELPAGSLLIVDTLMLPQMDQWSGTTPCILLVHHLRSMELNDAAEGQAEISLEAKALASFDALWGTSEFTAQYLRHTLGLSQAIFQIPPALDLVQGQERLPRAQPEDVIVVANWIPRKGILELLQAWRGQAWPKALNLTLVGNATLDEAYAQLCWAEIEAYAKDGGNKIRVRHDLSREEMLALYRNADLLISAATMETFGMAIQEAMALGLPVLLVEGAYAGRYVEEGKNGYCYSRVTTLVEGLAALLDRPERWKSLVVGARQRSQVLMRPWSMAGQELAEVLTDLFG